MPKSRLQDASAERIQKSDAYRRAYPDEEIKRVTITNWYHRLRASNVTVQQIQTALSQGGANSLDDIGGTMTGDVEPGGEIVQNIETRAISNDEELEIEIDDDNNGAFATEDVDDNAVSREERSLLENPDPQSKTSSPL